MWEELMQECVSAFPTHFHVGLFSFAPNVEVTQLVSGFLSEGVAPYLAVYSVHPCEEGSSGASVTILVPLLFFSFYF